MVFHCYSTPAEYSGDKAPHPPWKPERLDQLLAGPNAAAVAAFLLSR